MASCETGRDVLQVLYKQGQNTSSVSKAKARITSHSSGLRYAQPLNSSVSSQTMKTRKAEIADVAGVAELVRGLSFYYSENGQDELPEWFRATITNSAFADRFDDPEYFNFVAEIHGSIVGYVSVKTGFHLYHLFVSSSFHNQGIAKSLWQHCVGQLNIEQCTVRSSIYAIPVYSKLGFTISGDRACKDGIGFQLMFYNSASC